MLVQPLGASWEAPVSLCCFQTSGPLSVDTHTDLPPLVPSVAASSPAGIRGFCSFINVQDVMDGRMKMRRRNEAKCLRREPP